jgi:hypothetical protein
MLRIKNTFSDDFINEKLNFSWNMKDEALKEWDKIFQENEINKVILWYLKNNNKSENDLVF